MTFISTIRRVKEDAIPLIRRAFLTLKCDELFVCGGESTPSTHLFVHDEIIGGRGGRGDDAALSKSNASAEMMWLSLLLVLDDVLRPTRLDGRVS